MSKLKTSRDVCRQASEKVAAVDDVERDERLATDAARQVPRFEPLAASRQPRRRESKAIEQADPSSVPDAFAELRTLIAKLAAQRWYRMQVEHRATLPSAPSSRKQP